MYSCQITRLVREGGAVVVLERHFRVVRKLGGTIDTCVGHAQNSDGQWDKRLLVQLALAVTCILSQRVLDEFWDEMAAIRRRPEIYLDVVRKRFRKKLARYDRTLLFEDSLLPNFCIHTWRKNHVLRATACVLFAVLRGL